MIKEIKAIHPEFIALIKTGSFYCVYGKDASLIKKFILIKDTNNRLIANINGSVFVCQNNLKLKIIKKQQM